MNRKRSVLFIRCSLQEAEEIRNAARRERRTLSAFVLNCVNVRLTMMEKVDRTYARQWLRESSTR